MALRMAAPIRDPKSGVYRLKVRTPADVLAKARGTDVRVSLDDAGVHIVKVGEMVEISLRTTDARQAKVRHTAAMTGLNAHWQALRDGPRRLTHREVVALAGRLYRMMLKEFGDDPPEKSTLEAEVRISELVPESLVSSLMIPSKEMLAKRAAKHEFDGAMERFADALLKAHGIFADGDSRCRLKDEIARQWPDINRRLLSYRKGDYSPDPKQEQFPDFPPPNGSRPVAHRGAGLMTADALFELFAASARAKVRAPKTVGRYRSVWRAFSRFIGSEDVRSLTDARILAFAEHRRDVDGVAPRVINQVDLAALRSVFNWAASLHGGRIIGTNPVASELKLDTPKRSAGRDRTFTEDEVRAILCLADSEREPLRRWVPWLAAYTGARVAELTGLSRADVGCEGGVHFLHFAETKTGKSRKVPIHEHLVEKGFLAFVRTKGDGPLFHAERRPARNSEKLPAALPKDTAAQDLAKWIKRNVRLPVGVAPNHGWRHTWKTRALAAGIEQRLRDAITGHAPGSVGRSYETPTLGMLARAMEGFPRYRL